MKLYTIGFSKKSAKKFFELLSKHGVRRVIDIRLNNKSQLAGFTKAEDLQFFLKSIGDIEYIHITEYAPSKELLKGYQKKSVNWDEYEKRYIAILEERAILRNIDYSIFDHACFLCNEPSADYCHRRLLAEYLAKNNKDINIVHI